MHIQLIFSQVEYFNKVFTQSTASAVYGVVEKDSCYYTAGTILDSNYNNANRILLSKFSHNGDLLWKKSWGEANKMYVAGHGCPIILTHDNGFATIGGINDSTQTWHSIIMKHDAIGDTLWTKQFYDTISTSVYEYLAFYDIKESIDNGFIIVGEIKGSQQYDNDIFMIKLDSLGNTKWYNTYGNTYNIERGFSVIQTPDTGFLIGGYTYQAGVDYSGDGLIVKTDKFGNEQWQKQLGGAFKDRIAFVTMSYDSNYLVAYSDAYQEVLPGYPASEICVLKVSPSKQTLWSKKFRNQIDHKVMNIYELDDHNTVIVGYSYISDTINHKSGNEGFIMKLNEFGDSLWYREYSYQSYLVNGAHNYFYDLKPTSGGGYIACGYFKNVYQPFPQSTWLVKTDSMGCDTPGCIIVGVKDYQLEWEIEKVSVYPNPASDFINIEINQAINGALYFELIDRYGRQVKQHTFNNPSSTISLARISRGMYFYRVRSKLQVLAKGKLIVIR